MCYQTHLTSGICNVVRACNECGKVYHTNNKHVYGMVFCKVCRDHQPQDHFCFIKPLDPKCDDGGDNRMEEVSFSKYKTSRLFPMY